MFMGLLHHRMHKLNSGLGNSNPEERLLKTETRSGRPSDAATDEEMCNKVRDVVTLIGELRWKK